MFRRAGESSTDERVWRDKKTPAMRFGVDFLDDALRGIYPDDLVLLGAPSGVGKTQLCCNIAEANIEDGKRVHYVALEASRYEIERRLKYPLVAERYYADAKRPVLPRKLNYPDWLLGEFSDQLKPYEDEAHKFFEGAYKDLFIHYKSGRFGVAELIATVQYCARETNLIIIDHVHYFDFDDDNENRAIKDIAKCVRDLAIEENTPIILVAHLRKRDRQNDELVAGLDEFHGSSDLTKIATKVVTVSPGRPTNTGSYETFFRIPKNRIDGGVTRYVARELFSPKTGGYERGGYQLGWAGQQRSKGFEGIGGDLYPAWSRRSMASGQSSANLPSAPRQSAVPRYSPGQND